MKDKTIFLFVFVAMLLFSVAFCIQPVRADSSDPISFPSGITIFSPTNRTYNSKNLSLNLTLYSAGYMGSIDSKVKLNFSLDRQYNGQVPLIVSNPGLHIVTNAKAFLELPELTEGPHTLTLNLFGHNQRYHEPKYLSYVDSVYFSIDLTPPSILILSPENENYKVSNISTVSIPLNFIVNEKTSQVSYSLDAYENTTVPGNTSLTGLSIGLHNVTLYALDLAGNIGASEVIDFNIETESKTMIEPKSEPFPTLLVTFTSVVAVGIAAAAALLVYHKNRKRNTSFLGPIAAEYAESQGGSC